MLAPTRELAIQIELECAKLTYDAPAPPSGAAHWSACAYGGATARPQLEVLAAGAEILVATPGRLDDFLNRRLVSLARCRFLVLDEADRMLDMGFEPQIRKIVTRSGLPSAEHRQTLMFSATFARPMQRVAAEYLRGAAHTSHVTVGRVGSSMRAIEQSLVLAEGGSRRDKLDLIRPLVVPKERTIIFAGKKHVAKWLCTQLAKGGTSAVEIHGDRSQGQREAALRRFREGEADVLVATDVASRGLDVPDVAHVIQFDLPPTEADFDSYVHRIGRTGRAGKSGRATSLFVPGDEPKVGNGALWQPLARTLYENGQGFPPWFEACRPRSAQDPRIAAGGGVGADGEQLVSGRRTGASANRRARRAALATAAGRAPNAGPPSQGGPPTSNGRPPTSNGRRPAGGDPPKDAPRDDLQGHGPSQAPAAGRGRARAPPRTPDSPTPLTRQQLLGETVIRSLTLTLTLALSALALTPNTTNPHHVPMPFTRNEPDASPNPAS